MNRLRMCSLLLVLALTALCILPSEALKMPKFKLGGKDGIQKVLKGAGIVLLIKQFGGALNDFINTLLLNHGAAVKDATKVVPILTFGKGADAGACQVSGPPEAVDRVKIVLAVEGTFDKGERFKVQALVPSSSMNPLELNRVAGVGVSAIIDYRL